jgi:drug/metabolite transporter (DMT)-like permease
MDAVIFFPAFNGGVVILSGVLSGLIFKEKLSKKQWIGFSLGLLAIFIIGVF